MVLFVDHNSHSFTMRRMSCQHIFFNWNRWQCTIQNIQHTHSTAQAFSAAFRLSSYRQWKREMKYTNISISVYAYKCRCVCICYARRHIKITQPTPLLAFYALPVVSMHTASISELLKEKYARCRRRFYRVFAFSLSISLSLHHNHLQNRRATCAYSVKYQPHPTAARPSPSIRQ